MVPHHKRNQQGRPKACQATAQDKSKQPLQSMTKNNAFGGEKQNKKSNGEQSDLCDLEQVTLKPLLQFHHYLTTWMQIWYHSLLWAIVSERAPT